VETVNITQSEASFFDVPETHEGEQVSEYQIRLQIIAPSFAEGSKWKVSTGGDWFFASMLDETFSTRIQRNEEAFSKNDTLHVILRTTQWHGDGKLRAQHDIVKVIEHTRGEAPRQASLFDGSPTNGTG